MKWTLGLGAAMLAVLTAAGATAAQAVVPDEATLKLLPAETRGLSGIDVAGLRHTALIQELLAAQGYPEDVREFIEATGFQPDRDIEKVTVGHLGRRRAVAIIEARFDPFEIGQFLEDKQIATETYLGRVLYRYRDSSFALIDDRLIVGGNTGGVKQVVDRLAAPGPNVIQNTRLMEMMGSIEAGNQVWAVGELNPEVVGAAPLPVPGEMTDLLKALTSATYQMRVDQDLHGKATGNFANAEAASTTADLLRGLVAVMRMQPSQNPSLAALLNGMVVDAAGSSMTVRFDAPGDLLKEWRTLRRMITAD